MGKKVEAIARLCLRREREREWRERRRRRRRRRRNERMLATDLKLLRRPSTLQGRRKTTSLTRLVPRRGEREGERERGSVSGTGIRRKRGRDVGACACHALVRLVWSARRLSHLPGDESEVLFRRR